MSLALVREVTSLAVMVDKNRQALGRCVGNLPIGEVRARGVAAARAALPWLVGGTVVAGVGYAGYRWLKGVYDVAPLDEDVVEFLVNEWNDDLAEECLADVKLDHSTLGSLVPDEAPRIEETTRQWEDPVADGVVCDDDSGVSPDSEPVIEEPVAAITTPRVILNETPKLTVRESRVLPESKRTLYARRVYDACKAKFGTPDDTQANYRSVWRFAQGMMKDHGLRPAHQAQVLPMIVNNVFIPSLEEMAARKNRGALRSMINGRFDERLSTWERWSRKCHALFGRA